MPEASANSVATRTISADAAHRAVGAAVTHAGGLSIREHGVLIGGIGVSGGSAEQDEECARAGPAALGFASPT